MSQLQVRSQSGIKRWITRYCKIVSDGSGDHLMIFEDEPMKKLLMQIDLSGLVLDVAEADKRGWYYFTIDVIKPIGRLRRKKVHYYFRTRVIDTRNSWVSKIRQCIKETEFITVNDQLVLEQTATIVAGSSLGIRVNNNDEYPLGNDNENGNIDDDNDEDDEDAKSFSSLSSSSSSDDEEEDDQGTGRGLNSSGSSNDQIDQKENTPSFTSPLNSSSSHGNQRFQREEMSIDNDMYLEPLNPTPISSSMIRFNLQDDDSPNQIKLSPSRSNAVNNVIDNSIALNSSSFNEEDLDNNEEHVVVSNNKKKSRSIVNTFSRFKASLLSQSSSASSITDSPSTSPSNAVTIGQDANDTKTSPKSNDDAKSQVKLISIVETDRIEIFQNQRWLPISRWGSKMLPHDRAPYTDRVGKSMEKFYTSSLKKEEQGASANSPLLLQLDDDEGILPGQGRITRISNWTWSDPDWKVEQIPCLISKENPTLVPITSNLKDTADDVNAGFEPTDSKNMASSTPNDKKSKVKRSLSISRRDTSENVHQDSPNGKGEDSVEKTWATGTEFDFLDNTIARGVPGAEGTRENVRTRRLIRERKRVIQIQVPNENASELASAKENPLLNAKLINPSVWVPIKGWLGKKGHYGTWSNRYVRLKVSIPESLFALEFFDSKYSLKFRHQVLLGPDDSCRMVSDLNVLSLANQSSKLDATSSSATNNSGYASPRPNSGGRRAPEMSPSKDQSYRSRPSIGGDNATKGYAPREGRFEISLRKHQHRKRSSKLLLTADDESIGRAWVAAINQTLSLLRELNSKSLINRPLSNKLSETVKNNDKNATGSDSESASPAYGPTSTKGEKRKSRKMFNGLRGMAAKFGLRSKSQQLDDNDVAPHDDLDAANLGNASVPDTQEEPTYCTFKEGFCDDSLSDRALSRDGELNEMMRTEFPLGIDLRTLFQHILGDNESALVFLPAVHKENGDTEVEMDKWKVINDSDPIESPAYALCGTPTCARILNFRVKTNVSIGPSSTRVRKVQHYCFFEKERVLIWQHIAWSLDVPYGDCFSINERWVFRQAENEKKCSLVVFLAPIFCKSTMMKGVITSGIMGESRKAFVKIKKRVTSVFVPKVTNVAKGAIDTSNSAASAGGEITSTEPNEGSIISKITGVVDWKVSLFLVAWFILFLLQIHIMQIQSEQSEQMKLILRLIDDTNKIEEAGSI